MADDFEKAIRAIESRLNEFAGEFEGLRAQAGWFNTAKYPDGTPVAYVACIQENGAPSQGIPPRPFMRPAVVHNKDKWIELLGKGAKGVMDGKRDGLDVMSALAESMKAAIKKEIAAVNSPALKESTVKARARKKAKKKITQTLRKPLVDTGLMLASVSAVVTKD